MAATPESSTRLGMFLGFLEHDPLNRSLLYDAAEAALSEAKPDLASELLARLETLAPFTERDENLAGLVAIEQARFQDAALLFGKLAKAHPHNPGLQFNLAWSLSMLGDREGGLSALSDETVRVLGQAAALRVQILHDMGMFDEAAALAENLIQVHPDHPGLLAATSVLAMDVDNVDLARSTALRAGPQPDALVTLGLLSLDAQDTADAAEKFDQALIKNPASPRGWIGKGLVELADGKLTEATSSLQRGAELFKEHVGSWIAAGWAQVLNGDLLAAEETFRRAQLLDPNFADTQGSLAVVMLMTNRHEEGRRLAEVARRLDPKSLTAALASALVLASDGKTDVARTIVDRAMKTPVTLDGRSLQEAISSFALGR